MSSGTPSADAARTSELPALLVLTPSADLYGSDRALLAALPELSRRFALTVVAAVDGPMLDDARRLGAEVVVSPDWALRRRYFTPKGILPAAGRVVATLRLLRRLDRSRSFGAVYANTVASMVLPLVPLATRAPIVVHVREVPRADGWMNRLYFHRLASIASLLICNSTYTATFAGKVAPSLRTRTRVIHNGVEPIEGGSVIRVIHDGVDRSERSRAVPDSEELQIVCVGRLHPQKGQHVMLDALRIGRERGHRWRVHFWGDALPEHADVERSLHDQVRRDGLGDAVVWHGYSSEIDTMYAGMDVAVVPSTWPEGFSLVTAEAQSAGLPAIATGPGGPDDIIEEGVTGRIVPFSDPGAIVSALEELGDPVVRKAWGDAARHRAKEHFCMESYAADVAQAVASVSRARRR
ncbi:MAG: glycosyltransferase family 4 protein [Microthrixaceae bacterium]